MNYTRPDLHANGTLSYEARDCEACPSWGGYDCSLIGTDLATLTIASGYWRAWRFSTRVRQCFTEAFCVGTANETDGAKVSASNCSGGNANVRCHWSEGCAEHHTGPYCQLCIAGFIMKTEGCVECNGNVAISFVYPIVVLIGFIALVVYFLSKGRAGALDNIADALQEDVTAKMSGKGREDDRGRSDKDQVVSIPVPLAASTPSYSVPVAASNGGWMATTRAWLVGLTRGRKKVFIGLQVKLRIFISLFQVLGQLGVIFAIPYPPFFDNLMSYLSIISLDFLEMMPLQCSIALNHDHYLLALTLIPLLVLSLLYLTSFFCDRPPFGTRLLSAAPARRLDGRPSIQTRHAHHRHRSLWCPGHRA